MALDYLTMDSDEVRQAFALIGEAERGMKTAADNYTPSIRKERYLRGGRGVPVSAPFAPDAPDAPRHAANPLHGGQRAGVPLSRSGNTGSAETELPIKQGAVNMTAAGIVQRYPRRLFIIRKLWGQNVPVNACYPLI